MKKSIKILTKIGLVLLIIFLYSVLNIMLSKYYANHWVALEVDGKTPIVFFCYYYLILPIMALFFTFAMVGVAHNFRFKRRAIRMDLLMAALVLFILYCMTYVPYVSYNFNHSGIFIAISNFMLVGGKNQTALPLVLFMSTYFLMNSFLEPDRVKDEM